MPPDKDVPDNKVLIQNYINSLNQQNGGPASILPTSGEEEAETGVTYFVDEEGRYYYQPAGDNQSLVSLSTQVEEEEAQQIEEEVEEPQLMVEANNFQTVTLVPSEAGAAEVSYVLVVQEETKPLLNLELNSQKGSNDVYTFEEDDAGGEPSDEEEQQTKIKFKPIPVKRGKHSRTHFSCTFCSYTSPRRYLLQRHMKSHSQDRPHKCKVCERGFKTIPSLQNHVNMHNGVKPHICKYCKAPFTTSGELVRHVRYKHTHEKPHKCTECDYASVELSKLRRHVRCHTGERPYQCPHCTYASPDTFKLKRHLRTHTGEKPYKCDHCSMCFTQSNSLKAHKLIHNVSEKPVYQCELCPAKCGRKTDLRIHVQKLHTSDKPLKCKRCGKSFPDRYSCKIHNKTHEGEKCFKCELCPYASTTLRHLKSHMLKHTDEKPFVCEHCDQSFRQKQLLRRHQNLYHNPEYVPKPPKEKTHTCHACKRTFAHKGNLIRHLEVHDPESRHQERALALKLGRQKKIKNISKPKPKFESRPKESDNDDRADLVRLGLANNELKRGELVTVADGDGKQYVVLEVIQLEDGTEQQIAVVAPDSYDEELDDEEAEEEEDDLEEIESKEMLRNEISKKNVTNIIKVEQDMDACFGFNDEDEQEEVVLHLV